MHVRGSPRTRLWSYMQASGPADEGPRLIRSTATGHHLWLVCSQDFVARGHVANILGFSVHHSASIFKCLQDIVDAKAIGPIHASIDWPIQPCSTMTTGGGARMPQQNIVEDEHP